jgi:polygalacturonase
VLPCASRPPPRHAYAVTDYGAVGDNRTVDTLAFRAALAAAAASAARNDPAHVLVPAPGIYLIGAVNISSDTIFEVESGAVIRGVPSRDPVQYPIVAPLPSYGTSRDVGYARYQALIMTVPGSQRVTLTGGGTIDGGGAFWWDLLHTKELKHGRPHLVELYNSSDVTVSHLTLQNSAFWTLHPVYARGVHIHDLTITAPADSPNTDGIDPDSSSDVLIERCSISCGDDHIAIKSGIDAAGRAVNMPSRNITVRYNTHLAGRGISIGSEVSGGVENVRIEDTLHLGPSEHGLHIKTSSTRGGFVRNVTYRNVTLGEVVGDAFISLTTSYGGRSTVGRDAPPLTEIRGIRYESIRTATTATTATTTRDGLGAGKSASSKHATAGIWDCFEGRPCEDVELVNVNLTSIASPWRRANGGAAWSCSHVGGSGTLVDDVVPAGLSKCLGL